MAESYQEEVRDKKLHKNVSEIGTGKSKEKAGGFATVACLLAVILIASLPFLRGADTALSKEGFGMLCVNVVMAAIAYGAFWKLTDKTELGVLAAMLFTWCPYRLADLYLSKNVSQTLLWLVLPLFLVAACRCYLKKVFGDRTEESGNTAQIMKNWMIRKSLFFMLALIVCICMLLIFGSAKLIPWFMGGRDAEYLAQMVPLDFRGCGMYLAQYFTAFHSASQEMNVLEHGLQVRAMSPGIVVLGLAVWAFGSQVMAYGKNVTWKIESSKQSAMVRCFLVLAVCNIVLSLNSFPWDVLQNRNGKGTLLLVMLGSPARFGIFATACMIAAGILQLDLDLEEKSNVVRSRILLIMAFVNVLPVLYFLARIKF